MVIGVATPASAQLFGGSSTPDSEFTAAQTIDCDEDKTDSMTCEAAYFMNERDPALIGTLRMELGSDLIGMESYVFGIMVNQMEDADGYTNVTRQVDWEFISEYDEFAAFEVESFDPTTPGMTMILVLDGNDMYAFIFMEVDSVTAHDYTRDTLEAGELIVPPTPFEQVDPEDSPDVSFV